MIEQRLESKNYDLQIKRIESVIDQLKSEKRNVTLDINAELKRLNRYDTSDYGKPISMNDIVFIPVGTSEEAVKSETKPQKSVFSSKLDQFIQTVVLDVISAFKSN